MKAGVAEIYVRDGQGMWYAKPPLVAMLKRLPGVMAVYIQQTEYRDYAWDVFLEVNDDFDRPAMVDHTMRLAARLMAYALKHIGRSSHKRARVIRAWGLIDPLALPSDGDPPV